MAKVGSVNRNEKRKKLAKSSMAKRKAMTEKIKDKSTSLEERFELVLKLASLPRNGAQVRVRNRCALTGRPRGCFRKMGLSRNMIRQLAAEGKLPGIVKASW